MVEERTESKYGWFVSPRTHQITQFNENLTSQRGQMNTRISLIKWGGQQTARNSHMRGFFQSVRPHSAETDDER